MRRTKPGDMPAQPTPPGSCTLWRDLLPTAGTNACASAAQLAEPAASAGLKTISGPARSAGSSGKNWDFAGLLAGLTARSIGANAGGACTMDAACASSLYAIEVAARRLLSVAATWR